VKVLIAEDEAVSRRLLESSLQRWGYDVVAAGDGQEAARILRGPDAPKLVLLDWMMPGLDGLQLCRELRARNDDAYTYVVLLTSKRSTKDIVEGLQAGADDYITKPFNPEELKVRLRIGTRIIYLLDQLVTACESLRDQAIRDPLTKLLNRRAIIEWLDTELTRAARDHTSVGVVLLDLDHFKRVNDTLGHLAGDHVLREAAQAMANTIRPYDAIGRFGGEEFLMVLPGCDQINAVGHAERLREAFHHLLVQTSSGEVRFTASIGVTVVGPESYVESQTAIHVADSAMYAAKRAGRDRVEFLASTAELAPI
jgi:two-component system cell cycle response regulator